MNENSINNEFSLLGHKPALFVLFFTEMWERFSYYGMRAIFVLFLTAPFIDGGWEWSNERALGLLGIYTSSVYLTPIIGGWIADKFIGYQKAVAFGAFAMTLGHASLAFETEFMFYLGVGLLIIGNGLFKPNVTSVVSGLYDKYPERKDGAFTIFYMGVNSGGFLGVLLCGFLASNLSYSWGFGLAGIFMFLGMLQFWFGRSIFGEVGKEPTKKIDISDAIDGNIETAEEKVSSNVQRDRYIVVGILAFFVVFFWAAFEQAGSSLNIFASEYTDRSLDGDGMWFKVISSVISILPLGILLWLFLGVSRKLGKAYTGAMGFMGLSVALLGIIMGYMIYDQFSAEKIEVPATWFQSLNALFIFTLAPLFSFIWQSLAKTKYNPNGPQKFSIGLILLGLGFIPLVYGAADFVGGDLGDVQKVSMIFLVAAYLLHTMGELSLSPVGLSYVSKLSPKRLVGIMFGIWFFASAMGNKIAGFASGYMEKIAETSSMSDFFQILVYIPITAGIVLFALSFPLKKLMHGIK